MSILKLSANHLLFLDISAMQRAREDRRLSSHRNDNAYSSSLSFTLNSYCVSRIWLLFLEAPGELKGASEGVTWAVLPGLMDRGFKI